MNHATREIKSYSVFSSRSMQTLAALGFLLALCVASLARNAVYDSMILLWTDAVMKSPEKARPHYNLARLYSDQRRNADALREYLTAAKFDPRDSVTHYNIGNALLKLGRIQGAVRAYQTALALQPEYPDALHNLEVAVLMQIDSARMKHDRGAEAALRNNLGNVFFMRKEFERSRLEYEAALRIEPGCSEARDNLSTMRIALIQSGRASSLNRLLKNPPIALRQAQGERRGL